MKYSLLFAMSLIASTTLANPLGGAQSHQFTCDATQGVQVECLTKALSPKNAIVGCFVVIDLSEANGLQRKAVIDLNKVRQGTGYDIFRSEDQTWTAYVQRNPMRVILNRLLCDTKAQQ